MAWWAVVVVTVENNGIEDVAPKDNKEAIAASLLDIVVVEEVEAK